jgi:hypothetical protein
MAAPPSPVLAPASPAGRDSRAFHAAQAAPAPEPHAAASSEIAGVRARSPRLTPLGHGSTFNDVHVARGSGQLAATSDGAQTLAVSATRLVNADDAPGAGVPLALESEVQQLLMQRFLVGRPTPSAVGGGGLPRAASGAAIWDSRSDIQAREAGRPVPEDALDAAQLRAELAVARRQAVESAAAAASARRAQAAAEAEVTAYATRYEALELEVQVLRAQTELLTAELTLAKQRAGADVAAVRAAAERDILLLQRVHTGGDGALAASAQGTATGVGARLLAAAPKPDSGRGRLQEQYSSTGPGLGHAAAAAALPAAATAGDESSQVGGGSLASPSTSSVTPLSFCVSPLSPAPRGEGTGTGGRHAARQPGSARASGRPASASAAAGVHGIMPATPGGTVSDITPVEEWGGQLDDSGGGGTGGGSGHAVPAPSWGLSQEQVATNAPQPATSAGARDSRTLGGARAVSGTGLHVAAKQPARAAAAPAFASSHAAGGAVGNAAGFEANPSWNVAIVPLDLPAQLPRSGAAPRHALGPASARHGGTYGTMATRVVYAGGARSAAVTPHGLLRPNDVPLIVAPAAACTVVR